MRMKKFIPLFLIAIFFIYAVILLYFLQRHYFNNDDFYYLTRAERLVREPLSVLFPSYLSRLHPVFIFFLFLEYVIFGIKPFGYYFILITLHIINSYLIYRIFTRLGYDKNAVFFCSLLFLSSSLHFQSVTWIACQSTVLSTFFFLLGLSVFINYRLNYKQGINFKLILLYLLCILTVENSITLPLVLLGYDLIYNKKIFSKNKKAILTHLILMMIAISFTVITYKMGGIQRHRLSLGRHSIENLFAFSREVLQALLVPRREFVQHIIVNPNIIRILPYFVFIIIILLIFRGNKSRIITFWKSNKRFLLFPILWTLITLFPAGLRPMEGHWQARYLYIPLIGAYMLGGWFIQFLFYCLDYKKNIIFLRFSLISIIIYGVFLNVSTLIFMGNKNHLESRWGQPPEQEIFILSVIPQLKQMYPQLPHSSKVYLENTPLHGLPLRAIIDFYYQKNLKVIEVNNNDQDTKSPKTPYFYFKLVNGKLIDYSKF